MTTPSHWTIFWRRHQEPELETARKEYLHRMIILLAIQIGGAAAVIATLNFA
ncbi:MAG: hypothetical protein M3Q65_15065 [Chloroflexota bacterium]|nr:hypothetical protein [Chloroflexota bacterium]